MHTEQWVSPYLRHTEAVEESVGLHGTAVHFSQCATAHARNFDPLVVNADLRPHKFARGVQLRQDLTNLPLQVGIVHTGTATRLGFVLPEQLWGRFI